MKTVQTTPSWQASHASQATTSPSPAQILLNFVRTALDSKVKGDSRAYNKVLETIGSKLDGGGLARWYNALAQCVSSIRADSYHSSLIRVAFQFCWDTSEEGMQAHCRFLVDLVCSNGAFMVPVLAVLVKQMRVHALPLASDAKDPGDQSEEKPDGVVDSEELASSIHQTVHSAITCILNSIPSASTSLFPVLVKNFPHRRMSTAIHVAYVSNLLILSEYSPDLRDRILEMIIQKLLLIDVELQELDFAYDADVDPVATTVSPVDDEGEDGAEGDDDLEFLFDAHDADGGVVAAKPAADLTRRKQSKAADKLDVLVTLLIGFLDLLRKDKALLCDSVFESLLRVFESSVLTTHSSHCIQFVVFYMCSFKNVFAETFVRRLLERAFDSSQAMTVRVSCSLYVASFLAKAKSVRHATRMHYFEMLLRWVHSYVDIHASMTSPSSSPTASPRVDTYQHTIFYSLCQSLMYVFCEWRCEFEALVQESPELVQFFNFNGLVQSSLNPLRHCADAIVTGFATATLEMGLADCYRVIRRNQVLAKVSDLMPPSCFPFEPCRLQTSSTYILPVYENRPPQNRHEDPIAPTMMSL